MTTPQHSTAIDSHDARQAAEAAGRSAMATAHAAENAAKPGVQSSEFKATLIAFGITAGLGVLQTLKDIPGPWQVPAAIGVAILGAAAVYSNARGKVKEAALAGAASASGPVVLLPP